MHRHQLAVFAGLIVAAAAYPAVAGFTARAEPGESADPVGAAWPFGDFQLPGVSVGGELTGTVVLTGVEPYTDAGGDYSAQFTGVEAAFLGYLIHREVFDSANPQVPDGTTWDGLSLAGLDNTWVTAPTIGFGDQADLGVLTNTFIADTSGIQDTVAFGEGAPLTVFDVPLDLAGVFDPA